MTRPLLTSERVDDGLALRATGSWTVGYAAAADQLVETVIASPTPRLSLDAAGVTALDSFGAWLLERLLRNGGAEGSEAKLVGLPDHFTDLVDKMHQVNRTRHKGASHPGLFVAILGAARRFAGGFATDASSFLAMLGAILAAIAGSVVSPRSFRFTSAVHQLDRVGWGAIGIILMITFLIGGIIAQQGMFHFRRFGADDYVVDLVAVLILREIGVLIVAIMVAGRSGSSYTAELGSMKMREEIDALKTMGLDPVEILVLPRVAALVIALPILTFIGSMAALFGSGVVSWLYGDMSPLVYLARLKEAASLPHFEVGMIKAPFMALVIGIVAAAEGFRVKGSAESLGRQTTTSVVKSIFLVIVLDGLFAVFFAAIGI